MENKGSEGRKKAPDTRRWNVDVHRQCHYPNCIRGNPEKMTTGGERQCVNPSKERIGQEEEEDTAGGMWNSQRT